MGIQILIKMMTPDAPRKKPQAKSIENMLLIYRAAEMLRLVLPMLGLTCVKQFVFQVQRWQGGWFRIRRLSRAFFIISTGQTTRNKSLRPAPYHSHKLELHACVVGRFPPSIGSRHVTSNPMFRFPNKTKHGGASSMKVDNYP